MQAAAFFQSVSFKYPKALSQALQKVSFAIPENSFFALLGPNGAGKTTLLRLLCGRLLPTGGKISFADSLYKKSVKCGIDEIDVAQIGVLLENPGGYTRLSVEEYFSFFGNLYGIRDGARVGKDILKKLDFNEKQETRIGNLSLGNRQKVQIARTMLHAPRLLLLDEPAANLDPMARAALWEMLSEWHRAKEGTIVVTSHVLPELESYVTDFVVLKTGKVACCENVKSLQHAAALEINSSKENLLAIREDDMALVLKLLEDSGIRFEKVNAMLKTEGNILEKYYRKIYFKKSSVL